MYESGLLLIKFDPFLNKRSKKSVKRSKMVEFNQKSLIISKKSVKRSKMVEFIRKSLIISKKSFLITFDILLISFNQNQTFGYNSDRF